MSIKKQLLIMLVFAVWTLACIYGTYWNTVKHAIPVATETGYEITFGNTGETFIYK